MKRAMKTFVTMICVLFATAAFAETIIGVVTEGGAGSLRIKDDSGKELHIHHQRGMTLEPENFRAQKGDRIEIVYELKHSRRAGEDAG